jgi:RNA 2',3'-cyclic 3'-phosphodiesterase
LQKKAMKRLFAAIKVNPEEQLLRTFADLKKRLSDEKITWVNEQKIHITMKFFGDTKEEQIPIIETVCNEIVTAHRRFGLHLENVGIFGSSYNPRVIWFGIRENKTIAQLANELLDTLQENGFPRDNQHFRPHLTIGRIKHIQNKRYFQQVLDQFKNCYLQRVPVDQMELIESKLTPHGPVYTTINSFKLKSDL